MRNRRNSIKNEIAYFYTVIKNMDAKENIKKSKVNGYEIPLEDVMYDNFSDNFDVDKQIAEQSLLGWIELIENEDLHKAVKILPIEDQIFISYIVKEGRTQKELSSIYKVNQANICHRFNKILRVLKNNLFKK